MQSVDFSVGNQGYYNEVLSADHLGTNFLFHSDRATTGSDFGEVVDETGIRFIRYPRRVFGI